MASSSYVVKVQYEGAIRRLTLQPGKELVFSYAQLQSRTRDLFQVPTTAQLLLTYVDSDGDVVTMADDQDLQDALVMQSLNPLRLNMVVTSKNNLDVKLSSPVTQEQSKSNAVADQKPQTTVGGETTAANNTISKSSSMDRAANNDLTKVPAPVAQTEEAVTDGGNSAPNANSSDTTTPENNAVDDKENSTKLSAEKGVTNDKLRNLGAAANAATGQDGSEQPDIHRGIRCDGCGMMPISGPRFKSCKKANYDLCLRCFEACGGEEKKDYVKIDRRFYRLAHPAFFGRMMRLSPASGCRNVVVPDHSTSDSAADANVNKVSSAGPAKEAENGSTVDDANRIVHYGVQCDECGVSPLQGPRFKSCTRFNYDLCLACFEKSGSNAKEYTRLDQPAASCGYPLGMGRRIGGLAVPNYRLGSLCGHPVWVLNSNQTIPKEGEDGSATEKKPTAAAPDSAAANVVGGDAPVRNEVDAESAGVRTPDEVSEANKADAGAPPSNSDSKQKEDATASSIAEGDLSTLEGLSAKLVAMGFLDQTLNTELLERNKLDLRKTLDDLCAAEEWDPILKDLQEMGFSDANMNRRLLIKNNGSVKQVVKDLVQLYKGEKQA